MACKWSSNILSLTMLLLLEGLAGMAAQMAETSLEMHTTGRIPCNHNFPDGSFDSAKWTKSTSDHYYVNGGEAFVTWNHNVGVASPNPTKYNMTDTDLSLVIRNVSLEDAGIYRCTVFPINLDDEKSESDNKLSVYKQPNDPPVLTYHIQGDEIIFTCSVGTVFPLNFPEIPYPHQNNHTVLNKDGTYVTSVSAAFQYDGSRIQVECSYSYRNQHWHSSLTTYRDNRDGHAMTTESGQQSSKYSTELSSTKGQNVNHPPVPVKGFFSAILLLLILILLVLFVIVCKILGPSSLRNRKNKEPQVHAAYNVEKDSAAISPKDNDLQNETGNIGMRYTKRVPTKPKIGAQQEDTEESLHEKLEETRALERILIEMAADLEHHRGNQVHNDILQDGTGNIGMGYTKRVPTKPKIGAQQEDTEESPREELEERWHLFHRFLEMDDELEHHGGNQVHKRGILGTSNIHHCQQHPLFSCESVSLSDECGYEVPVQTKQKEKDAMPYTDSGRSSCRSIFS